VDWVRQRKKSQNRHLLPLPPDEYRLKPPLEALATGDDGAKMPLDALATGDNWSKMPLEAPATGENWSKSSKKAPADGRRRVKNAANIRFSVQKCIKKTYVFFIHFLTTENVEIRVI
jgi:hypothetical protein